MEKVNLEAKLAQIDDHWHPRIVGELNGQHVKLVKVKGTFVWHQHEAEDELFYVLKGELAIEFRDKTVRLGPGEMLVIPRGVEHRPAAAAEVHIMLFEPAGTRNTGNVVSAHTIPAPEHL